MNLCLPRKFSKKNSRHFRRTTQELSTSCLGGSFSPGSRHFSNDQKWLPKLHLERMTPFQRYNFCDRAVVIGSSHVIVFSCPLDITGRGGREAVLIVLSFFSSIEPADRRGTLSLSLSLSLAPCIRGVVVLKDEEGNRGSRPMKTAG